MSKRKTELVIKASLEDKTYGFKGIRSNLSLVGHSLDKVTGNFKKFQQAQGGLGGALQGSMSAIKNSLGVASLLGGIGSAISLRTAADFESEIAKMRETVKVVGVSYEELIDKAKRLGAATQFTNKEAMESMKLLGSSGWSSQKIFAAVQPILHLTGASRINADVSLAEVTEQFSDAMNAFDLPSSIAEKFGDQLAYAFSNSSQTFPKLMENFSKLSALANTSGLKHTEALAFSMALADKGVKSNEAGTAMAGFLGRVGNLPAEAKKVIKSKNIPDAEYAQFMDVKSGKINNFLKLFEIFVNYKFTPGQISETMGQEAGKYLASIINKASIDKIAKNKAIFGDDSPSAIYSGTAKRLNDASLKGLNGAIELLGSSIEGLSVNFAATGILDFATYFVNSLRSVVDKISEVDVKVLRPFAFAIAGFGAVFSVRFFGGLLKRAAQIANMGGLLPKSLTGAAKIFGPLPFRSFAKFLNGFVYIARILRVAMAPLLWIQGIIGALVIGLGYAIWFVVKNWDKLKLKYPVLEKIRLGFGVFSTKIFEFFDYVFESVSTLFAKMKQYTKTFLLWSLGDEENKAGFVFNPLVDLNLEPPKAPEDPHARFTDQAKKEKSEKNIKVTINGEKMPQGVAVTAVTDKGRKYDLPVGMAMEFAG